MKNKQRKTIYRRRGLARVGALLVILSMLFATGCTVTLEQPTETTPSASQPSESTNPIVETEPTDPVEGSTEATGEASTEPTQPEQPSDQTSLTALRQEMAGTPQLFAVAYFGYHENQDADIPVNPHQVMQEYAPQLWADRPFMADIPTDSVVGDCGHLFCIVPLDTDASVAVSIGRWDEENGQMIYDDMLYSRDSGEPILLFCNDIVGETDTQLYISGPSGEMFWSPDPVAYRPLKPLLNEHGDSLLLDFSSYEELLTADYWALKAAGWTLPTQEILIGKTWGGSDLLEDGRELRYQITFEEEVCSIRWNDGTSEGEQELSYPGWELTEQEGFAMLTVELFNLSEAETYRVLYQEAFDELYVARTTAEGLTYEDEPLYRYLSHFTAPETTAMVGTWEQSWAEVEGDRSEIESGACMVEITLDEEGQYRISLTDHQFPQYSFESKKLIVGSEAMYTGCGNDQWMATVDHTGPGGMEYAITVLHDGSMLMRQYWEMDGAPCVSYGGYQPIF